MRSAYANDENGPATPLPCDFAAQRIESETQKTVLGLSLSSGTMWFAGGD